MKTRHLLHAFFAVSLLAPAAITSADEGAETVAGHQPFKTLSAYEKARRTSALAEVLAGYAPPANEQENLAKARQLAREREKAGAIPMAISAHSPDARPLKTIGGSAAE